MKKPVSVADIPERGVGPTIQQWLRRVNQVPDLTSTPLSNTDRVAHLPELLHHLICCLPCQQCEIAHLRSGDCLGKGRHAQGCSAPMPIDESRLLEVCSFNTLHLHESELEQERIPLGVMVIADEVDMQLIGALEGLLAPKAAKDAGPENRTYASARAEGSMPYRWPGSHSVTNGVNRVYSQ